MLDSNNPIHKMLLSAEHFTLEKEYVPHPVSYNTIMQYQQKDKSLI